MTETGEATDVVYLTQQDYDRLKAEWEHLSGPGREEIAGKIEAAREEGDLKENGGYHAAKEEQGKQEARIRQLRAMLDKAQIGEPAVADGVAGPGMVVSVRFADGGDEERFLIGSREVTTADDLEVYSPQSPIGKALTGKKVGERADYQTPTGRTMSVELLDVQPHVG